MSFFRTPKGILTLILAILLATAAPWQNGRVALGLASGAAAGGLLDLLIRRRLFKVWEYPSGAMLTAAIIVMVLPAQEPWYVNAAASAIAIASKYVFRFRRANVFNPAALAMVACYYLFHAGESWWGAQADAIGPAKLMMVAMGLFVASRVNKMPLVLAFFAAYFLLFTVTAFVGDPLSVAEIFRTPDLEAALYFALIILTDPPTSPVRYRHQVICGVMVAAVSWACFLMTGVVYYLLAGVLVGNVWEAWRRASRSRGYRFPGGVPTFVRDVSPWRSMSAAG